MFLTKEKLYAAHACTKGCDAFNKLYPNGAELIDVINNPEVDRHLLHWGRKSLDVSKEEIEAYEMRCEIFNSQSVFESDRVKNSHYVSKSRGVDDSEIIFSSKHIHNCAQVYSSVFVEDSKQVSNSSYVYCSRRVVNGQNINGCDNVVNSNFTISSDGVCSCTEVVNCSALVNGTKCDNVHFSRDMINCKNCLFCNNLENKEYHIFNQPVSPTVFELVLKQFKTMGADMNLMGDWDSPNLSIFEAPHTHVRWDIFYSQFDDDFFDWTTTLPNFDNQILYLITYINSTTDLQKK